jgi:hypothetical protein
MVVSGSTLSNNEKGAEEGSRLKMISKAPLQKRVGAAVALLMFFVMMTPCAMAKAKEAPTQSATVIAHLPLSGPAVNQMFLQQEGSKQYLYIQQASKQAYTVIDVTKPDRPNVTNRMVLPSKGSGAKLQMLGGGIALAAAPETSGTSGSRHELVQARPQGTTDAARPTESVRVLDLSDPKNPRTLQIFEGVTSVLADDARKLIYITNADGLWVLKHKETHVLPPCDSGSAFNPIADCQ